MIDLDELRERLITPVDYKKILDEYLEKSLKQLCKLTYDPVVEQNLTYEKNPQ